MPTYGRPKTKKKTAAPLVTRRYAAPTPPWYPPGRYLPVRRQDLSAGGGGGGTDPSTAYDISQAGIGPGYVVDTSTPTDAGAPAPTIQSDAAGSPGDGGATTFTAGGGTVSTDPLAGGWTSLPDSGSNLAGPGVWTNPDGSIGYPTNVGGGGDVTTQPAQQQAPDTSQWQAPGVITGNAPAGAAAAQKAAALQRVAAGGGGGGGGMSDAEKALMDMQRQWLNYQMQTYLPQQQALEQQTQNLQAQIQEAAYRGDWNGVATLQSKLQAARIALANFQANMQQNIAQAQVGLGGRAQDVATRQAADVLAGQYGQYGEQYGQGLENLAAQLGQQGVEQQQIQAQLAQSPLVAWYTARGLPPPQSAFVQGQAPNLANTLAILKQFGLSAPDLQQALSQVNAARPVAAAPQMQMQGNLGTTPGFGTTTDAYGGQSAPAPGTTGIGAIGGNIGAQYGAGGAVGGGAGAVSPQQVASWASGMQIPVGIGQSFVNQFGRLPLSPDELDQWGNATGRRSPTGAWSNSYSGEGTEMLPIRGATGPAQPSMFPPPQRAPRPPTQRPSPVTINVAGGQMPAMGAPQMPLPPSGQAGRPAMPVGPAGAPPMPGMMAARGQSGPGSAMMQAGGGGGKAPTLGLATYGGGGSTGQGTYGGEPVSTGPPPWAQSLQSGQSLAQSVPYGMPLPSAQQWGQFLPTEQRAVESVGQSVWGMKPQDFMAMLRRYAPEWGGAREASYREI